METFLLVHYRKVGARKQTDYDDWLQNSFTSFAQHFGLGLPSKFASFLNVLLKSHTVPQTSITPASRR